MSNDQPRKSKRLAGASTWEENDGDFQFTRASKRVKTATPEGESQQARPLPKKAGRGRPPKQTALSPPPSSEKPVAGATRKAPRSAPSAPQPRRSRRKASLEPESEESQLVVPKRTTRKSARKSTERIEEEEVERRPARGSASQRRHDHVSAPEGSSPVNDGRSHSLNDGVESAKITLPVSDTPVINRNKEMRKKGAGQRRSSLGMRGRRASSLIESGHSAIPHSQVSTSEFYKHIEAGGLSEPRRMKQLLTWCGERALLPKPPHGSTDSSAINGARAIQDLILKDFANKSECSDWFAREEAPVAAPKVPVVLQPNPRNVEHEKKIKELEDKIKRLEEEKAAWSSLKKAQPPELPPLFPEPPSKSAQQATTPTPALPELKTLDANEARMLSYLTDPATSFESVRRQTQSRLQNVQSTLEFKIDQLADGVHKLLQRVDTAGREADKVLSLTATRLKEREDREKTAIGTKEMPTMEVLRSLGRILPENGD